MKQNKAEKLLVGVLAVSLAMGVSVMPAFADYEDMDHIVIKKNYELTNPDTASPAETFHFDIERDDVTDAADGVTAANMPLPTIGSVEYGKGEAGSATKTKEIRIDLPTYSSVGVYTYIIREVEGSSAGVSYYGDDILLRVTVIEQDGKIRVAAVHTENPEATGKDKKDSFANTYSAGELDIHKDVEGILGDKSKYFEFTLTLIGEEGKVYDGPYAVTGGSYASNPTEVNVTPGGLSAYTFHLKDGDTLHIENLPYGVEYSVSETEAAGYETTSEGTAGKVDEAVETASFTNTKNGDGVIDTGVALDSVPYLFTLTGAAGVGLMLTLRRRRQK